MRNFIVTIDGKSYSVGVEEVESSESPKIEHTSAPKAKTDTANAKGEKILSPFPGLIKNILVENGSQVKKDQPIIVLEAMKMDNEITATCSGKITLQVLKGSNVETNATLAFIE